MHLPNRPSTAIALIIASLGTTGCPFFGCGDLSVDNEVFVSYYDLNDDNLVELWNGGETVDPNTPEGCEAMCTNDFYGSIETIHSCEVEFADSVETDSGITPAEVEATCILSGYRECVGGRFSGTLAQRAGGHGEDAAAAWLAREACGEAGSVHAFRQLVRELIHHGAPTHLVDAARSAVQDEVRHTRMVRRLARHRGGTPEPVEVVHTPPRDVLTVALENAVEGCVHETYAAARAGWQAKFAADPQVRAVSAVLASDESRHADLAAAIHQWICSVLPAEDAETVEQARRDAWVRLANSDPDTTEVANQTLGLPNTTQHRRLVTSLASALAA